jgi:nardilysin
MSNSCDASSSAADVTLGPDLNSTRSKSDKKLYRHITLSNGLKCVLICDTVALRQRKSLIGRGRLDDGESEGEDDEDDADEDNHSNDDDDDDDYGLRKAATALLVNVGSYHDPPYLQGLTHFLEHMLFLGTEDYPEENAYDKFLSSCGGDDNAYTGVYILSFVILT